MREVIYKSDVEAMLSDIGGCDASDPESKGWDSAINAAKVSLAHLRTMKHEEIHPAEKICRNLQSEQTVEIQKQIATLRGMLDGYNMACDDFLAALKKGVVG